MNKITVIYGYCWEQTTSILETNKSPHFFSYEKWITVIIKLADMYVCIKKHWCKILQMSGKLLCVMLDQLKLSARPMLDMIFFVIWKNLTWDLYVLNTQSSCLWSPKYFCDNWTWGVQTAMFFWGMSSSVLPVVLPLAQESCYGSALWHFILTCLELKVTDPQKQ